MNDYGRKCTKPVAATLQRGRGGLPRIVGVSLVSVSLVSAPKCSACGETMAPASDYQWKCDNEQCFARGTPVNTGVYPMTDVAGQKR